MSEILVVVLPSVLSSLVVGMGSSYLTAQKVLAEHRIRLSELENKVDRIEETDRTSSERLVRLETKMDIILDRMAPAVTE